MHILCRLTEYYQLCSMQVMQYTETRCLTPQWMSTRKLATVFCINAQCTFMNVCELPCQCLLERPLCCFPGCWKPCYCDQGRYLEFCGRTHGQKFKKEYRSSQLFLIMSPPDSGRSQIHSSASPKQRAVGMCTKRPCTYRWWLYLT